MSGLVIGLAVAGAGFVLLSFFLPNKERQLEKEVEELSLKMLQETYQLNKKLKVIEEELLIGEAPPPAVSKPNPVNDIIKSQVLFLHQQNVSLAQIAAQSSLPVDQVKSILLENKK